MPQLIPKTVVFFDSKREAYACLEACRNWLQQHGYSEKQAKETIKIFQRDTAQFDKEKTIAEFQKLDESSLVHVIFATKALEMNVNLPDVQQIVVYGLPKKEKIATVWQQNSRAERDDLNEEIIILIDK